MKIEKATLPDAEELVKLINSAYRGESSKIGWTTEAYVLEGTRIDVETMEGYLRDDNITILKYLGQNGEIKGCVYLEVKNHPLIYLGMLTVSPWEQAKGLGRELLTAAEKYCLKQNCTGLEITVITTRHELIDWYKRRGFYDTGEIRPFPVHPKFGIAKQPIELLVMHKDLT